MDTPAISFSPNEPNAIALITTFRCNAACPNCCYGCRPDRGRTMTLEEMKHYVDVCLAAYPNSIRRLSLTGGECFLLGSDMDEIVKYGQERGLTSITILSNGYWGRDYKTAYKRISKLKEYGLTSIGFTVGSDHQSIMPLKNSRNAIVASARAGYRVSVRIETKYGRSPIYDELSKDTAFMRLVNVDKISLEFWGWNDYNNETLHVKRYPSRRRPMKEGPCNLLFREIQITPYGDILACGGIGAMRNPYMRVGNINAEPIKDIYERSFEDALKVWIHQNGASDVLQYVYDNSNIRCYDYDDGCGNCIEIFTNPKILPFLRDHYEDWIKKLKYAYVER